MRASGTPIRVAGTLISAILYGLAFPTAGLQPLAWVAQVPFLVALRRSGTGAALFLGWLFAVTVAYVTGDWFPRAVATYYAQPLLIGVGFFFGVSSIMAAPYVMAFALAYRRLGRRFVATLPFLTAAAWVAGELARTTLLTGCPWAVFGYSQSGTGLAQMADIAGVYGPSFVLVAVNAALAEMWMRRAHASRRLIAGLVSTGAMVLAALEYGAIRLHEDAASPGASTPITIVQGNLEVGSQWRSEYYGRNLDIYIQLSEAALEASGAALLFWPESAMSFFLDQEPLYRQAIGGTLSRFGARMVAGGPRAVADASEEDGERYYNSTFSIAPSGEILERYDKMDLLPFAEHFPFRSLGFLRRSFGRVREFAPGSPTPPLDTPAGRAGIIVCNEAMFPGPAAARVAAGAEYLVNPSNDSWLGDRKFSEQVFDMIRFRAVEQRRYVVRASTSGPSAIIDPYGRVLRRTETFTRAWIDGRIEAHDQLTTYARFGDAFAIACLLVVGAATMWPIRRFTTEEDTEGTEDTRREKRKLGEKDLEVLL